MNIELKKQIDELTIEEYTFYFMDNGMLFLNTYRLAQKENKRQRSYRTLKKYDRISSRESTITEDDVPFSPELKQEAIDTLTSQIKCLKWSERSGNK